MLAVSYLRLLICSKTKRLRGAAVTYLRSLTQTTFCAHPNSSRPIPRPWPGLLRSSALKVTPFCRHHEVWAPPEAPLHPDGAALPQPIHLHRNPPMMMHVHR